MSSNDAAKVLAAALFATFGWHSRYNPNRPPPADPRGPWQTFDNLPDGILSGDADNEEWAFAAERFLAALPNRPAVEATLTANPASIARATADAALLDRMQRALAELEAFDPADPDSIRDHTDRAADILEVGILGFTPAAPDSEPRTDDVAATTAHQSPISSDPRDALIAELRAALRQLRAGTHYCGTHRQFEVASRVTHWTQEQWDTLTADSHYANLRAERKAALAHHAAQEPDE